MAFRRYSGLEYSECIFELSYPLAHLRNFAMKLFGVGENEPGRIMLSQITSKVDTATNLVPCPADKLPGDDLATDPAVLPAYATYRWGIWSCIPVERTSHKAAFYRT